MLVDDKLAKELAEMVYKALKARQEAHDCAQRISEDGFSEPARIIINALTLLDSAVIRLERELIRNTDLTDCQPQKAKAMNEHSSGTRAEVPPSATPSGAEPAGPAVDSASGAFQPATEGTAPVPAALRQWKYGKLTRFDAFGLAFIEADGQPYCFGFEKLQGYRGETPRKFGLYVGRMMPFLVQDEKVLYVVTDNSLKCPKDDCEVFASAIARCNRKDCPHGFADSPPITIPQMQFGGKAQETSTVARARVKQDGVPDQGSVRNATDELADWKQIASEWKYRAEAAEAKLRALPDQKD